MSGTGATNITELVGATVGPYVIAVGPAYTAGAEAGLLRATDHITGLPALLQVLREVPAEFDPTDLPPSPALLPFTDYLSPELSGLPKGALVSELPLNAVPATDPWRAARGALTALHVLHAHGRAHGFLHPAQLWDIDGVVRVTGGGLFALGLGTGVVGQGFSVERDLQALANVLDELGGLPAPLQVLRNPPAGFGAKEALGLLVTAQKQGGQQPGDRPTSAGKPPTAGIRLPLSPDVSGVTSASVEPLHKEPVRQEPIQQEPVQQPVPSQNSVIREPSARQEAGPEAPVNPAVHSAGAGEPQTESATPVAPVSVAATRAAERLKADAERQRRLAELRVQALSAGTPGEVDAAALAAASGSATETPQERRRREFAARQAEEKSSEQWRAEHPPQVNLAAAAALPDEPPATAEKRQIKPVKFGWDSQAGKWQAVQAPSQQPGVSGVAGSQRPELLTMLRAVPVWLWPLLALLLALLVVGLWRVAHPRAASALCCDVRFNVQGPAGQKATLLVQGAPVEAVVGRKLGTIPGVVHFPGPGKYRLNVMADGYSPAPLDVVVPLNRAVVVRLGP